MRTNIGTALTGWLPYQLQHEASVRWLYTHNLPFTDPFFDDTIFKSKALKENSASLRTLSSPEILQEWSTEMDAVMPSAIIFHVSRCGSTLLSQLLGLNEEHIVLSEVPFFDDLLRARYKENGVDYSFLLRDAVTFYGQKRTGNEKKLFIKTDSWHLFFYEQWRALYPDIPFILLYRRPNEVVRSQSKKRGLHAVPGIIEKEIFQLGELPEVAGNFEVHMAAVLEQYYKKMQQIAGCDNNAHLFNYKQGLENIVKEVIHYTGAEADAAFGEASNERVRFDAKDPTKVFDEKPLLGHNNDAYLQNAFAAYKALDVVRESSLQYV